MLLQVGYWRRFVPELRPLRERILAGELGEISQLSCMQWDPELPSEQFRAHSGGIAVDMGVHEFDQTRWLLGQEFEMGGRRPRPARDPGARGADPDSATCSAQLSGGTAATISLGRQFPHADSCWLEVWGTEATSGSTFMWDDSRRRGVPDLDAAPGRGVCPGRARRSSAKGPGGNDAVAASQSPRWPPVACRSPGHRVPPTVRVSAERPAVPRGRHRDHWLRHDGESAQLRLHAGAAHPVAVAAARGCG